jgi:tetratricopeptide (TPR) repeat protein
MGEVLLLVLLLAVVALAVAWPLLDATPPPAAPGGDPERDALEVRHQLALEAIRDIEADHRAGSLDDDAYRRELDEAESHAVLTRRALDGADPPSATMPASAGSLRRSRLIAAVLGGSLALLLLAGYALPAPFGVAERDARLERIRELTAVVGQNARDTAALAELSDLYLAGGNPDDVAAALASLILLRDAAPDSRDAHQRLITLLIRAGLWDQAATATDAYVRVVGASDADVPFFRGLIARGTGNPAEARLQFERFLQLAPNDDRAPMVQGLLHQVLPSPS